MQKYMYLLLLLCLSLELRSQEVKVVGKNSNAQEIVIKRTESTALKNPTKQEFSFDEVLRLDSGKTVVKNQFVRKEVISYVPFSVDVYSKEVTYKLDTADMNIKVISQKGETFSPGRSADNTSAVLWLQGIIFMIFIIFFGFYQRFKRIHDRDIRNFVRFILISLAIICFLLSSFADESWGILLCDIAVVLAAWLTQFFVKMTLMNRKTI